MRKRVFLTFIMGIFLFGGQPWSFPDSDRDGLSNREEHELAQRFVPTMHFADEEKFEVIYQVTRISNERVVITYMFLYLSDRGVVIDVSGHVGCVLTGYFFEAFTKLPSLNNSHTGDAEMVRVEVVFKGGEWRADNVAVKRHDTYDMLEANKKIEIFVSENKHAMYSSMDECGGGFVFLGCRIAFERCADGLAIVPRLRIDANVGQRENPIDILKQEPLSKIFPYQSAWDIQRFCGVYPEDEVEDKVFGEKCGGRIYDKWTN